MKVLILEDNWSRTSLFIEIFGHEAVYVSETVPGAVELFDKYAPFDLILLDHDLSDEDQMTMKEVGTGTEFAKFLATQAPHCQVIIHSYNPDGAARMEKILHDAGWDVVRQPFGLTLLDQLRKVVANER